MSIPKHSKLFAYAKGAYFADSFSREIPNNNQTALDVYLEIAKQTPAWVSFLMATRNRIVSRLGLKHLGRLQDAVSKEKAQTFALVRGSVFSRYTARVIRKLS